MLHLLSIRHVAIVDSVDIELAPGMTAVTGETGAGKSLLVDALHLLLGGRSDTSLVRSGAREATVTGLFSIGAGAGSGRIRAELERAGVPVDVAAGPDRVEVLVRRVVPASGRGRAYINDTLVTLATLGSVMDGVIDIMGQHEHQSLLRREHQLELLDAYGDLAAPRRALATAFDELRALLEERAGLARSEHEKTLRLEYLRYQIDELEEVDPQPGELDLALAEQRRLAAVDKLRHGALAAEAALYSDERAACGLLGEATRHLASLQDTAPELRDISRAIEEAQAMTSDAARDLGRFVSKQEQDPERLELVAERVDLLRRLGRKHGVEPDLLSQQLAALRDERAGLDNAASRLAEIDAQIAPRSEQIAQRTRELSALRQEAAQRLAAECGRMLNDLAMGGARIEVVVEDLPMREGDEHSVVVGEGDTRRRVTRQGADRVELLLSANPGEPPRPLARVASGGELSRVSLALRRALADRDGVPTYIFDEVDAAIGGATAEAVGIALKSVSDAHQVVCVTHLPQVAALADQQLRVSKHVKGRVTKVDVTPLKQSERVEELARMLGGARTSDSARRHARSLLSGARP